MRSRLWYPQLDVASAARRFVRILDSWKGEALSVERLFVFDYFVATPALIGDIKMTNDCRKRFNELGLPKKKNEFLVFPPATLLFHSMLPIQKRALVSLVAKNVLSKERYDMGAVSLRADSKSIVTDLLKIHLGGVEDIALNFMADLMSTEEFSTKSDLRSRTGLRYYD